VFFSSADASKSGSEKAKLYDTLMQEKFKAEVVMKYGNKIVPSHKLQSGLLITLAAWNNKDLGKVNIILHKQDQGSDAISHKLTRDKVVKSLDLKISAQNISHTLTSADIAEYNVAADALSWQATLKGISCFCTQYNMTSLIIISQDVQLSKPHLIAKATVFTDAIENWQDINDKDYFFGKSSLFVLAHRLKLRVTTGLTTSFDGENTPRWDWKDINSISKYQRSSITTQCCIIKQMGIMNQEAKDALEN
jgi:hypothetical protein